MVVNKSGKKGRKKKAPHLGEGLAPREELERKNAKLLIMSSLQVNQVIRIQSFWRVTLYWILTANPKA